MNGDSGLTEDEKLTIKAYLAFLAKFRALRLRAEKAEAACAALRQAGDRLHDDLVLYHSKADVIPQWNAIRVDADAGKGWISPEVAEQLASLVDRAAPMLADVDRSRWNPSDWRRDAIVALAAYDKVKAR